MADNPISGNPQSDLALPASYTSYLATSAYTAGDVLAKLLTVDGVASGIDAQYHGGVSGGMGAGSVATNTAFGTSALSTNGTGATNVAIGYEALKANTIGANNTALGYQAMVANTTGTRNTAIGRTALSANTTGVSNTYIGMQTGYTGNGSNNVGVGDSALLTSTASSLVAVGYEALKANTTGASNTAVGYQAGLAVNTGADNTALGYTALNTCTTGVKNTAIGSLAGTTITTGSNLTCIGYNAEPSSATATNEVTLGDANVAALRIGSKSLMAASVFNADTVSGYGIGAVPTTTVTDAATMDAWIAGGQCRCTYKTGSAPFATDCGIFAFRLTSNYVVQLANKSAGAYQMKVRLTGDLGASWTSWYDIWNSLSDGNGGQPPAPKPQTGAGNIGIMTALDVASGGTLTMPAGSGTYQWVVLTYGATVNSVKTGQTAAAASPGGTASANCTVLVWRIV